MPSILCPTRGGEASYPNQEKAIQLAKERQAELIFIYIYNIQFLSGVGSPVLTDMQGEMEDLGEFLLAMAQERAEKAGVHAEAIVRRGDFVQALSEIAREHNADSIVIGSAATAQSYTNASILNALVQKLQADSAAEIIVLHNGEIQHIYPRR